MVKQEAPAPLVDLDSRYYKTIAAFEKRFPAGAPSLKDATRLLVKGDWTFEAGVSVVGDVSLEDPGEPRTIPAGTTLDPAA
jgi:UTP--glucose-1-phosphate uridylyltransferase